MSRIKTTYKYKIGKSITIRTTWDIIIRFRKANDLGSAFNRVKTLNKREYLRHGGMHIYIYIYTYSTICKIRPDEFRWKGCHVCANNFVRNSMKRHVLILATMKNYPTYLPFKLIPRDIIHLNTERIKEKALIIWFFSLWKKRKGLVS